MRYNHQTQIAMDFIHSNADILSEAEKLAPVYPDPEALGDELCDHFADLYVELVEGSFDSDAEAKTGLLGMFQRLGDLCEIDWESIGEELLDEFGGDYHRCERCHRVSDTIDDSCKCEDCRLGF